MKATISNKIHLSDLKQNQADQIKKSLTFKNPAYSEAIRFNRSVRGIPREIALYDETQTGLVIPRGVDFARLGTECNLFDDQRHSHPVVINSTITPRLYQERAIKLALTAGGGVIVAPTGAGKTTMGIEIAARLGERCLILVKSLDLAKQWQSAIKQFTGLDCGLIGGGKFKEGAEFTAALVQTLIKNPVSLDYGLVLMDECHNTPAQQAYTIINAQAARYRFGLSATPQRRDGLEFLIHAALGPVVAEIEQHEVEGAVLPVIIKTRRVTFNGTAKNWVEFQAAIVNDEARNLMVIASAMRAAQNGATIILCAQVGHCELLGAMAQELGADSLVLHGQLPAKVRSERMAKIHDTKLVIGTQSLLSEGIDVPALTNLIFAAPVSAEVKRDIPAATRLRQSIGRCRRPYPGKLRANVLDIIDTHAFGLAAFKKRNAIYKQQGFSVVHENIGEKKHG